MLVVWLNCAITQRGVSGRPEPATVWEIKESAAREAFEEIAHSRNTPLCAPASCLLLRVQIASLSTLAESLLSIIPREISRESKVTFASSQDEEEVERVCVYWECVWLVLLWSCLNMFYRIYQIPWFSYLCWNLLRKDVNWFRILYLISIQSRELNQN